MPKNEYEQTEFVMSNNMEKLITDAKEAFDTLKTILDQIPTITNPSLLTGNLEDDTFVEELAVLEDMEDLEEDDEEDEVEATYYGRGYPMGNFGHGGNWGHHTGCCACQCNCGCIPKPQFYPCECRKCDQLKAKAYTNLVLGLNDLKDAFDLLPIVKGKFDDAVDSLRDAKKLFKKARCCSIKFGCECYCKTRTKRRCKCPR